MLRPYISQPCRYRRSFLDPHRAWGARMPRLSCLLLAIAVLVPRPALAQSGAVTPSDNLVTDGLPPVPAAIAEAARPYSVFTKDVAGAEFFQKYRYDAATGEITLLTDGKSRNVGGAWSHKGDRYAYMSTRRTGRDLDLWVVDPSNPATDRMVLQLQGGGYGPLDWSPDDRTILLSQGVSVNESYLWLVDAASGQKTLLAPQPGSKPVAYGDAKFSPDGKGIYLSTDQGSEFRRLAYLDLATRGYRFLTTAIPWDVDEFDLSPDGRWNR